jgi:hypothetical protein
MQLLKLFKHTVIELVLFALVAPIGRLAGRRLAHFLHVGKTGGTAIKTAFGAYPLPVRLEHGQMIIFHKHSVRLWHIRRGDSVFFFLRDPLARFVSGFNGCLRKGRPTRFVPWTRAEHRAFETFPTPDSLGRALGSEDFIRREKARAAMNAIEHVSKQSMWVRGGCRELARRYSDILMIGFQENLQEDFETLKTLLGVRPQLTLPASANTANRAPARMESRLSREARANLAEWYREDYALIACARKRREEGVPLP